MNNKTYIFLFACCGLLHAAETTLVQQTTSDIAASMQRAQEEGNFKNIFEAWEADGSAVEFTDPVSHAQISLGYYALVDTINPQDLPVEDVSKILRQFIIELDGVHLIKQQSDDNDDHINLTDDTNARLFQESKNFMSRLPDIANERREQSIHGLRRKIESTDRIMPRDNAKDNLCLRCGEVIVEISVNNVSFKGKLTDEAFRLLSGNNFVSVKIYTTDENGDQKDKIIEMYFEDFVNKVGLLNAVLGFAEKLSIEYAE